MRSSECQLRRSQALRPWGNDQLLCASVCPRAAWGHLSACLTELLGGASETLGVRRLVPFTGDEGLSVHISSKCIHGHLKP